MRNQFSGPSVGMRRFLLMSVLLTAIVALVEEPAYGSPRYPATTTRTASFPTRTIACWVTRLGRVAHQVSVQTAMAMGSSTTVISTFMQPTTARPCLLRLLPLDVVATPTPGGNLEWTFTFSGVNGALAGQMNISTSGPSILSAQGGPLFLDDGINPVGVPGFNEFHAIQQGISFSGNKAFAALGTTLSISPSLFGSNSTLEFLRLVTAGTQPTTLTYAANMATKATVNNGSASYGAGAGELDDGSHCRRSAVHSADSGLATIDLAFEIMESVTIQPPRCSQATRGFGLIIGGRVCSHPLEVSPYAAIVSSTHWAC